MRFDEAARRAGARVKAEAERSELRPGAVAGLARSRRRRSMAAVAVAVAALAALTVLALPDDRPDIEFAPAGPGPQSTSSPPACAADTADDVTAVPGWGVLPPAPLPSADAFDVAWIDGTGLFVVTGARERNAALLDLDTGAWTCLPDSPLRGRVQVTEAGGRLVVWNGTAATAYDPHARVWSAPAAAPSSGAHPLAILSADDRVLVWWRSGAGGTPGAAWDVSTGRWSEIGHAPAEFADATATWSGDRAYLVGTESQPGTGGAAPSRTAHAAAYDPATDSWTTLPAPPLSPQAWSAAWFDGRLVVWDYELRAAALSGLEWTRLPPLPLEFSECYPSSAVVGDALFAYYCNQAALWDGAGWEAVTVPDDVVGEAHAVGDRVAIVVPRTPNFPPSSWLFHPAGGT